MDWRLSVVGVMLLAAAAIAAVASPWTNAGSALWTAAPPARWPLTVTRAPLRRNGPSSSAAPGTGPPAMPLQTLHLLFFAGDRQSSAHAPQWVATLLGAAGVIYAGIAGFRRLLPHSASATVSSYCEAIAIAPVASKKKKDSKKSGKPKAPGVDTKALLRRSEKEYAELSSTFGFRDHGADVVFTEWVVAVRAKPGGKVEPALYGWVPICSIGVVANDTVHKMTRPETLVASMCREIGETLAQASASLRNYPRNNLEYSVEPMPSWESFVLERKSTKDAALYAELGLAPGADAALIKAAYRRLASQLHPDLHTGDPKVQEENTERMKRVQEAYKTLGGGYEGSLDCWYAALGGRARTEFSGTLDLSKEKMAGALLGFDLPFELGGLRCAVAQLDVSVVQEFMAINAMRHRLSLSDS